MSLTLLGAGSAGSGLYPGRSRISLWLDYNRNAFVAGGPGQNGWQVDKLISRSVEASEFEANFDQIPAEFPVTMPGWEDPYGMKFDGATSGLVCSDQITTPDGFFAIYFRTGDTFPFDQCLFSQCLSTVDNVYWRLLLDASGYLCLADRNGAAAENRQTLTKCAVSTNYGMVMRQGAVVLMLDEGGFGMQFEGGDFMFYEDSMSLWIGDIAGDMMTMGAAVDSGGVQDDFNGHIKHIIVGEDELTDALETWLLTWMAAH